MCYFKWIPFAALLTISCSRTGLSAGSFSLDLSKSKLGQLSARSPKFDLKIQADGRFEMSAPVDLTNTGSCAVQGNELHLTVPSPGEGSGKLLNALEGRPLNAPPPLVLKLLISGPDELVWKPGAFKGQKEISLVLRRTNP